MAAHRYSKPPIVEAVFEFQFLEPLSARDLERLRERFKSKYPTIEEQQQVRLEVTAKGVTANATPAGFKMTSSNAADVVLMQVNRFGSVRLAPYVSWDEFIKVAKENYESFTKIIGRKTLSRVSSRFVNRIDIPLAEMKEVDMLEFVRFGVAMPEEMSKSIGPYSVAANFQTGDIKVLVQSGVVPAALIDHLSISLDIDVYIDKDIKPHKEAIWEIASNLHDAKNKIFEASITDRVRAHFK